MVMRVSRLIDACVNGGAQYADCISLQVKKLQVDVVDGEASVSRSSCRAHVLRALASGCWGISVASTPSLDMAKSALRQALSFGRGRIKLADRRPVQGGYVICQRKPVVEGDGGEVVDYVKQVVEHVEKEFGWGLRSVEGHVEASVVARAMMSSDGVNAYELKPSITASFHAYTLTGDYVSVEVCGSGGLEVLESVEPTRIADEIVFKLTCNAKAKALNPLYRGSTFDVLLSPQASASIVQFVVENTLNAFTYPHKRLKGFEGLTIYDDPTLSGGFGSFFFDDEGVKARRKKLMESGRVVTLLHSRETAYQHGVEPTGNGRGLAEPPKPMHSNIVVKGGDWNFKEMMEETKLGFLIDGVKALRLVDGFVIAEPDAALVIERGEPKEPVKLNCIAVKLLDFYSKVKAVASSPLGCAQGAIGDCKSASYSPPLKVEVRAL